MFAVNNIITRRPPVRTPNGTRPASAPHPSGGGSRGYVQEMGDQVFSLWINREDLNAVWIELLWHQRKFPCLRTCGRWIRQYQEEDHSCHRRPTGNHFSKPGPLSRPRQSRCLSNCPTQGLHRQSPCICAQLQPCKSAVFLITDW